jgi:hypothetical protein
MPKSPVLKGVGWMPAQVCEAESMEMTTVVGMAFTNDLHCM